MSVPIPCVVLKFGGTSVSTPGNWQRIADILRERLAQGMRPVVVHSALSGITDHLESLFRAGPAGVPTIVEKIRHRHLELASGLKIAAGPLFEQFMSELQADAASIGSGSTEDLLRARIMAKGELMATVLGARYLNAQGLETAWVDVRTALKAGRRLNASDKASVLNATCDFAPDPRLQEDWSSQSRILITQGFIASDEQGHTVLLGRGGSDTSAAYLAAKLSAMRLEIWTDVPGMFSANPRDVPSARLLRSLHYDEAQEIASNGAKVLHPRCILPVRQYRIPLHVHATQAPHLQGTVISASVPGSAAQVKAIAIKKGITLVSMESPGMWHQVGFLADAFQVFKQHGLSVDLVSTSETNVTVSLDPAANTLDRETLDGLAASLSGLCRVQVIGPCASLSLVGHNIRGILHELGGAFELFENQNIHLVSQAANDLNFTFVIDESQGDRLVQQLHERLIQSIGSDDVLGPTWQQLFAPEERSRGSSRSWWLEPDKRERLLRIAAREGSAFVYDRDSLLRAVASLRAVRSVDRWAYAMKANWHADILRLFAGEGLMLECVSRPELDHVFASVSGLVPDRVIFTPNFAPRAEYAAGMARGVHVTLDNLHPLQHWPDLFRGRELFIRVDPGFGRGHHQHVRTAGVHSKFGIPLFEMDEATALVRKAGARVVGLHAHTGSGIFGVDNWTGAGSVLADLVRRFDGVRVIDLGGGLGVPEHAGQVPLDLAALDAGVSNLRKTIPGIEIWMEPGRFLVAQSGVLIAQVTQTKGKGDVQYVGVATGMNSLIRPALYGSHHDIINLTRSEAPADQIVNVVGPICESADLLGQDRWLPRSTCEGDVLLIATAGAYGRAMSSSYNMRPPATEVLI